MDDYWKIKDYSEEEENECSLNNWIKNHWESILASIIAGSLLIIAICSIIITCKK